MGSILLPLAGLGAASYAAVVIDEASGDARQAPYASAWLYDASAQPVATTVVALAVCFVDDETAPRPARPFSTVKPATSSTKGTNA